jgi:hypothetical protein
MGKTPISGASLSHSISGLACVSTNVNLGVNAVAAVIYRMLMKHSRYRNKVHAYKWCIHINLFPCTPNTCESPPQVPALRDILRDWKEFVQKLLGRHCTQELTTCFLGETIVPIMYFRGIFITARSLVGYRSAGRIGRVWDGG